MVIYVNQRGRIERVETLSLARGSWFFPSKRYEKQPLFDIIEGSPALLPLYSFLTPVVLFAAATDY